MAEAGNVNIYDLTEPGRPMWMRFISNAANYAIYGNPNALSMLNGVMAVGSSAGYNPVDFARDSSDIIRIANQGFDRKYPQIALRNAADGALFTNTSKTPIIVNNSVNAVAMTVLPDAPIDPATSLRVPTIAVATGNGVSVIKHNGTVSTVTSSGGAQGDLGFLADGRLFISPINGTSAWYAYLISKDLGTANRYSYYGSDGATEPVLTTLVGGDQVLSGAVSANGFATTTGSGFLALSRPNSVRSRGLVSRIKNTYNTGWLVGDARRAYLSDVTAESISGSELVTNGTFNTDTSGWTASAAATLSTDTGRLKVASSGSYAWAYQAFTTVIGKTYRISFDTTNGDATIVCIFVGTDTGLTAANYDSGAKANGSHFAVFTATATTTYFKPLVGGVGKFAFFDNISVQEAVLDRSYKAASAPVFGTLAKSQLASGTSLVGYSGFSASNYLREPYSTDLDFGTGEWNASAWVNVPATLPDASFPTIGSELVTNGNFSSGTGWTLTGSVTISGGVASFGSGTGLLTQNSILEIGKTYKITFTLVTSSSGNDVKFHSSQWSPEVAFSAAPISNGPGTFTVILKAVTTNFRIDNYSGSGFQIDNISVRELGSAIVFDRAFSSGSRLRMAVTPAGLLTAEAFDGTTTRTVTTYAPYNIAKWLKAEASYTTDGSLTICVNGREVAATRGNPLLTLTSRYNQLSYTDQFDNGAWIKIGVTVPSTTEVAQDATTTADKIVAANNASASRFAYQSATVTSGGTFTYSVYAKAAGYTKVALMEIGTGRFGATFDLVAVTSASLGGAGYVSSNIADAGGGWYRCWVTFTSAASSYACAVVGYPTGTAVGPAGLSYAGNGVDGIVVWGAQVELGSAPTAYQRVTAAAETNVAPLTIGNSYAADAPFPGTIALLKLGATVPTPEQAQFMYEQEKQMFRANAQSVMPDAGAVVDMAYDDATDRWVAVSAANESYWTGLVRNTVTPVPAGSYTKIVATSGIELAARITTNPGVDVTIPAYGLREELVKRSEAAARLSKELVTFDYVGGFTANTTNGNTAITSASPITYPASYIGARISGSGVPANTTIVAVSGTTLYLSAAATATATTVSITFLDFALPAGMEAKVVFNNGVQTREGTTGATFSRLYDGFVETIRFAAAPGATNIVNIQAQRTS